MRVEWADAMHSPDFNPEKLYKQAQREPDPFIVKHNLRGDSIDEYIKEFQDNERQRIYTSSRQVAMHHTVLSWGDADAEKITDEMLHDLANKYIELRGENNLYLGTVHREKDDVNHVHLHLAMSATRLDGISSRIPKDVFQEIKIKLQEYQKEKYPELSHSLPKHRHSNEKEVGNEAEKNIKRNERALDKDVLQKCLDETYKISTSREDFLSKLQALGHEPYFRNGKFQGVKFEGEHNFKFRISRLGYDEKKLQALDIRAKEEKDLKELTELRNQRSNVKEAEQTDIFGRFAVIDDPTKGMTEEEQRNYSQGILDQDRAFERDNGLQTDSVSPSLSQFENVASESLVHDNIGNDDKREMGNKNSKLNINDDFDVVRHQDLAAEEYLHLQSLRSGRDSRHIEDVEVTLGKNEEIENDTNTGKDSDERNDDKELDDKDQGLETGRCGCMADDDDRER